MAVTIAMAMFAAGAAPARAADPPPPAPVVVLANDEEWNTSAEVELAWSADYEGLAGFATLVDDAADSDPGSEAAQTDAYSTLWLEDGYHWFHVRAVLEDGTLSDVAHVRIAVDTTAPQIQGLTSSTHPADAVSAQSTVSMEWSAAPDTSGVEGYDVRLTQDFIAPEPGGEPEDEIDTSSTTTDLLLPADGEWYVHVRGRDHAGLWGPFATYGVALDTQAPGAPTVTGTHLDGVETDQRHVAMSFTPAVGDHVEAWAAVIDTSPESVPDAGLARLEPRIAAPLEPGEAWLHVRGQDVLGRWGAVTHVKLVIGDGPYALDVPAGAHYWSATSVSAACVPGQDLRLLVVATTDASTQTREFSEDAPGHCVAPWDPTETMGGERLWPDGSYQLGMVDSSNEEVAARVSVTVAASDDSAARLQADYDSGRLTSDELAQSLVQAALAPEELAEDYQSAAREAPSATQLIQALMADGTLSDEFSDALTPIDESAFRGVQPFSTSADAGMFLAGGPNGAEPGTEACGDAVKYLYMLFHCWSVSENFVVYYNSGDLDDADADGTGSVFIATMVKSLERARSVYQDEGFRVPDEIVNVYMSPAMPDGSGVSLPPMPKKFPRLGMTPPAIIMDSHRTRVAEYLPHHEMFHQVEYQYFPAARTLWPIDSPYWWLEASAEWGAHLVQKVSNAPGAPADGSFAPTNDYASHVGEFLANMHGPYDDGSIVSPGGPEYGAFVLAEYLEQKYGGSRAIARTWERIGKSHFGRSPAGAIEDVMRERGDTYADGIRQFREWTYTISRASGRPNGFADDEERLPTDPWWGNGLPAPRAAVDAVQVDGFFPTASGSVDLSRGSVHYIEVSAPFEDGGKLEVHAESPDTDRFRMSVMTGFQGFPAQCPYNSGPASRGTALSLTAAGAPEVASPVDAFEQNLDVPVGGQCGGVVVVITSTAPMPAPTIDDVDRGTDEFGWSLTFRPSGHVVDSGGLVAGVDSDGTVGYRGSTVENQILGLYNPSVTDTWGIADGTMHGSTEGQFGEPNPVTRSRFTSGLDWAASTTVMGDLQITHQFRQSEDADLFAIDVTVARQRESASSSDHVRYRRTMQWSQYTYKQYFTWARTPGGSDTQVALLDTFQWDPDPAAHPAYRSLGYVARSGPGFNPGATLDLDLGPVAVGTPVTFTLYLGISPNPARAAQAVSNVDADVYALAESARSARPYTATFAYRAGGTP